jgi:hypothetical protein
MISKVKSQKTKPKIKLSVKKKAPKGFHKKYSVGKTLSIAKEAESLLGNYLNRIICGDSLEVMRQLPEKSIDLIVTSPPYNLKNSTGNGMSVNTTTPRQKNLLPQHNFSDHPHLHYHPRHFNFDHPMQVRPQLQELY